MTVRQKFQLLAICLIRSFLCRTGFFAGTRGRAFQVHQDKPRLRSPRQPEFHPAARSPCSAPARLQPAARRYLGLSSIPPHLRAGIAVFSCCPPLDFIAVFDAPIHSVLSARRNTSANFRWTARERLFRWMRTVHHREFFDRGVYGEHLSPSIRGYRTHGVGRLLFGAKRAAGRRLQKGQRACALSGFLSGSRQALRTTEHHWVLSAPTIARDFSSARSTWCR
jgi:hypothetical protein